MKRLLCLVMVIGFICSSALVSFAAEYTAEEAAKHIGEKATVCGKIIDTLDYQGMVILGMGKAVMEAGAVGIEVSDSLKAKMPKDLYVGKDICVTGELHTNPSNGASIKVDDLSQIKVK